MIGVILAAGKGTRIYPFKVNLMDLQRQNLGILVGENTYISTGALVKTASLETT